MPLANKPSLRLELIVVCSVCSDVLLFLFMFEVPPFINRFSKIPHSIYAQTLLENAIAIRIMEGRNNEPLMVSISLIGSFTKCLKKFKDFYVIIILERNNRVNGAN